MAMLGAAFALASCAQSPAIIPGQRVLFNDAWSFSLDGGPSRTVDLPHDWGVEGAFAQEYPGETGKLRWWGVGEYRKTLSLSQEDLAKDFFLEVDGAMSYAEVYVNGTDAGGWPYGYASWCVRLTDALRAGDNEILIRLDNPEESSRWYPGGGIYRNVWLRMADRAGIAFNGVRVDAVCDSGSQAEISVTSTLRLAESSIPEGAGCTLRVSLIRCSDGRTVCTKDEPVALTDGLSVTSRMVIDSPELWSPDTPSLYQAKVELTGPKTDVSPAFHDSRCSVFGIRSAEFRPDGFWLNGRKTFLKGVCLHHDAGALGAAWNTDAWVRRLLKLKEMGCNAIRMTHNPPAPELLDLCDQLGFLAIDELTDTWTVPKKPNGYARIFDEWVEKDLVAMIRRDCNHPCIIAWSIGNEVGEQGIPEKWQIARRLTEICHREDPTRPTTAGNDNVWAAFQPYASTLDVYGFNYKPHAYADFCDSHPGQPFYGSETASCISTRGYYLFPVVDEKNGGWLDGKPYQVSSYDLYAPAWASKPDYEWQYEDQVPECAGEFVWTGYDYLGEPTPYNLDPSVLTNFHTEEEKQAAIALFESWGQKVLMEPLPSRSSYFGIMDLAGFPKDRFWLYQARWRPELPMAHLVPHWTWPGREGQVTPVHVYTSGKVGELFLNGKSLGIREKSMFDYRLRWDDALYEPGTLEVRVYEDMEAYRAGTVWATDKVCTAGEPASISLSVDYAGQDLVYVTAAIVDADGNLVPDADNHISFSVSGKAIILATDAGDPTSHAPFRSPEIDAFNGLASVIIRRSSSGRAPSRFTIHADSPGLRRNSMHI